ncbi:unnamed protein product [Cylicocyclus nassatus]|uniref:Uncharacterized protein n=1 Tax=Cylicocyclus nassatus TaxID=53992 RepID=A0AA36GXY1_CYLNA|nr:unnamed protein product [Cylicocyclus nassatus]
MGRQFDIIFLDACLIQKEDDSICPIRSFQRHAVIQHLAELVGKKGIVFVNVVSRSSTKVLKEMISAKYDQHFKYRKQTRVEGTGNYILSYSQYKYEGLASSSAFEMKDV